MKRIAILVLVLFVGGCRINMHSEVTAQTDRHSISFSSIVTNFSAVESVTVKFWKGVLDHDIRAFDNDGEELDFEKNGDGYVLNVTGKPKPCTIRIREKVAGRWYKSLYEIGDKCVRKE